MLHLRPHHILDIVRNIGNSADIVPHPYGHNIHIITRGIILNADQECELITGNDDVCGPCIHLKSNGQCDDILNQLEIPVSKQGYNDELDARLLKFLKIRPNTVIRISDYLRIVQSHIGEVAEICTHPKESKTFRKDGMEKGIVLLLNG